MSRKTIERWKIRIGGYGTFEFEGTEAEAEEMRVHKANWERGHGMKWRVANQTELDKLLERQAALWDAHMGCPMSLVKKIAKARAGDSK